MDDRYEGEAVSLRQLSDPAAVTQAMEEYDTNGRDSFLAKYGFGPSYGYVLVSNGREYDSKAIAGAAHGYQFPELGPLRNNEFSGGVADAARKLRELGYEVVERDEGIEPGAIPGSVLIHQAFEEILADYARARIQDPFGGDHPLWRTAESLAAALQQSAPVRARPNLRVKASFGVGNWAKVPWIAILDLRETNSTQRGVYCVYLFRQDMTGVYATFNQGVTEPHKELGTKAAKEQLRQRAEAIRSQSAEILSPKFSLDDRIDLRADVGLGAQYEDSTIAYRLYDVSLVPDDTTIVNDLEVLLQGYDRYMSDKPKPPPPEPRPHRLKTLADVVDDFADALKEAHVSFGSQHERLVRSLVASLVTKGFVILTGLSGSGKTQMALRFGDWLGSGRTNLIPVRPDWTGAESLFGFEDALQPPKSDGRRVWHVPQALEFMLASAADPHHPYLLILDEMNLAHVERYFADVLSGMESAHPVLPNLRKEADGLWRPVPGVDSQIRFPTSLVVVGTVNVDETTYMFSPKVLDRANVFEFRVETADLQTDFRRPVSCRPGDEALVEVFLTLALDSRWHLDHQPDGLREFASRLREIHGLLSRDGFEFGFRVFYEATRFAAVFAEAGDPDPLHALDLQVMQKVLPRLHGSRRRLEPTLKALASYCFSFNRDPETASIFDPLTSAGETSRLPSSFAKLQRMTTNLRANQFTSFTE